VQNSDNVVLIKAREIRPLLHLPAMLAMQAGEQLVGSESHDFHFSVAASLCEARR
jgi:hypothetical protein